MTFVRLASELFSMLLAAFAIALIVAAVHSAPRPQLAVCPSGGLYDYCRHAEAGRQWDV